MTYWDKNREILQQQYSGLWEEICDKTEENFSFDMKIETAPAGDPSLTINGIHIHSPRDPVREGERLAQSVSGEKGVVVILGFGLGYAAQAAASLDRPIIIIEKYKSLFVKALELRDFSDFLTKSKVIFVIGGAGEGITNALIIADEILAKGEDGKKNTPSVIRNKALTRLDEQWYRTVEDKIRTWSTRDDVNAATHKRFAKRWVRNLKKNLTAIRDLPGISHLSILNSASPLPSIPSFSAPSSSSAYSALNSFPVFLAAAGPSLDKIKPLLGDIYDRFIIIAVDTSLRFFVNNGVIPDFVVVVDPQFWNSRHLDRCICPQTALIAESAVYPPVLSLPFSRKFLCGSLFPLGAFIEKQVDPKGRLGAGGSVSTTAWDFARSLGAQEIWLAGLDLAFPDYKTHFRGARFEEQAAAMSNRFNPVEKWVIRALRDGRPFRARSGNGAQVLTDQRLSLYAAWFEAQFKQNAQVANYALFQDGLEIAGVKAADSEKLLALPKRRSEINTRMEQCYAQIENDFYNTEEKQKRKQRYDNAVASLSRGLDSVKTTAEEGAKIARNALENPLNLTAREKVLKDLDKLTRRLAESEVKEIVSFLMSPVEEDTGEKDPFRGFLKSALGLFEGLLQAV